MTESNNRSSSHDIEPIFLERWSPRAFSGEPVAEAHLMSMLEAAHWSPSASNHQPWRFIYAIRGTDSFSRLLSLLVPGNQRWAKEAGALLFIVSKTLSGEEGDETRRPIYSHSFDAGAAWMALSLQAHLLGYHAHAMAGIELEKIPQELNLPDDVRIEAAVAIGIKGMADNLPEDLQTREVPSGRKPLSAVIFNGTYA